MNSLDKPCIFFEQKTGGHKSKGNIEISSFNPALRYIYLYEKLEL